MKKYSIVGLVAVLGMLGALFVIQPFNARALSMVQIVTGTFTAQNNSGQTGTFTIMRLGGNLEVKLDVTPQGTQPAHIHKGTCDALGEVVYPLYNVVDGKSNTTLNSVNFSNVNGLVINIHKSNDQASVYTACAPIKVSTDLLGGDTMMKHEDKMMDKMEKEAMKIKIPKSFSDFKQKYEDYQKLDVNDDDLGDFRSAADTRQAALVNRSGHTILYNAIVKEFVNSGATTTGASADSTFWVQIWFHRLKVRKDASTTFFPQGATLSVGDRVNIKGKMIADGDGGYVQASGIYDFSARGTQTSAIQAQIDALTKKLQELQALLLQLSH